MTPIRVLLADDDPLVRSGLRAILDSEPRYDRGGRGGRRGGGHRTGTADASRHRADGRPDAACRRDRGHEATRPVRGRRAAVIVVTTFENDDYVYDALQGRRAGVPAQALHRGRFHQCDPHGPQRGFPALPGRRPPAGDPTRRPRPRARRVNLTDREAEVLRLIAQGRSNSEIAAELFLGVETVKTHVRNVLAKLGARDRVQAVITAYESGFIR